MRIFLAVCFCFGALLCQASSSRASKPHCRIEHIDLLALEKHNQLKIIGGVVELEGKINTERPAREFRLQVNNKTVARAEKLEPFERSGQELYIALLVEISALYAPAIDKIKETLKEFIDSLPPRAKVKLILFGYDIEQQPTFMPSPAVSPLIDDINPDDQGDVQLLNAINAGLASLNKVQPSKDKSGNLGPPPRKVMVVLSDGLNQLMDRKTFRRIGDLLKLSNVPLFPVAFSPRDDRGPLLNLGELAKRSTGTFRWAQKDDNLKEQFQSLSEELRQVHIISFPGKKLNIDELRTATFTMICGDLKSPPYIIAGAPPPKPSTWWKWLLGILGLLIGLWLLAQGALFVLRKRAQASGQPLVPGGPPVPGKPQANMSLPPGRQGTLPVAAPAGYYPIPETPGGRRYTATIIGIGAGALGGKRMQIDASLTIGKATYGPNSLLVPDDPSLGDVHCELRRDGGGFVLFDMGAPSGCHVNDRRISGPTRLADGDILRLGEATQIRFRLDD